MQISVQMYSVRDALAEDYQAAVGRLVDLGFSVAEPFALLERRDDLVRARESHDISFPSAHQSFLGDGDFAPVLEATLRDLLAATEVPAANEVQCGWGAHHTLEGAQQAARAFLDQRDQWEQVTAR